MSNYEPIQIPVSRIRNVWARRLAIVLTYPFMLAGAWGLLIVSAIKWWCEINADLFVSAAEQWRRK
jgi:hypothetical protein